MREILLTNGGTAKVDDADYERVAGVNWYRHSQGYATTTIRRRTVSMHRLILNAKRGEEVDHIDRDPSNNQRANLRIVSHAENMRNRGKNKLQSKAGRWLRSVKQQGAA